MPTPCQTYAASEGYAALDKLLFTTPKRAQKGIDLLCSNCPTEDRQDCANRAGSVVAISGPIDAEGVFGGVFRG